MPAVADPDLEVGGGGEEPALKKMPKRRVSLPQPLPPPQAFPRLSRDLGKARGGHEREAREGDDGTERGAISLIINSNILQKVIESDWGRGSLSHVGLGFRPKI